MLPISSPRRSPFHTATLAIPLPRCPTTAGRQGD